MEILTMKDSNKHNNVLRGNKYTNYTKKESVDDEDDVFEKIPGNIIRGTYLEKLENVGMYNYNLYIIDSDRLDNKHDKIFGCKSLDRQMKEVNIGDKLEIEYVEYNDKKNYHVYKVSKLYF